MGRNATHSAPWSRNKTSYEERIYCIWDEAAMRNLPNRKYVTERRAIERCIVLLYFLDMGNTYTIWNMRTGKVLRQFTRKMGGIIELEPQALVADEARVQAGTAPRIK